MKKNFVTPLKKIPPLIEVDFVPDNPNASHLIDDANWDIWKAQAILHLIALSARCGLEAGFENTNVSLSKIELAADVAHELLDSASDGLDILDNIPISPTLLKQKKPAAPEQG